MLAICGKLPHIGGMSKSIRVSDELLAEAKRSAALHHRSPPQQIEHWAQIGRVMESTLSWPAQERVGAWGREEDIDKLLKHVESPEGKGRAREKIRQSSGTLYGADPVDPSRVVES